MLASDTDLVPQELPQAHIYLVRAPEDTADRHWYTLHIQMELFSGYSLVSRWGRRGHVGCRERRQHFTALAEAHKAMMKLCKLRLRNGYKPATARSPRASDSV